jgi:putative tricarboxylic transport membrane protein
MEKPVATAAITGAFPLAAGGQMLRVPYSILAPLIILFCLVGAYSVNNGIVDIWILIVFGVVGYFARKFRFDAAPLILALILGPIMENSLRRSLIASRGDFSIFWGRPISAVLLALALALVILPALRWGIGLYRASPRARVVHP